LGKAGITRKSEHLLLSLDINSNWEVSMNTSDEKAWVKLRTVNGDITAEMLCEALRNADVPCEIKRSMLASGLGAHSVSLAENQATLLVPPEKLAEAKAVLEAIDFEPEGE
jgi:hypothetical protein